MLAALEVMRTLNDPGITTRRPLELVNWTNEEGVRFEPAMLASGAVAGRFTPEYVYGRTDRDGATFGDELQRIGYKGERGNRPGPIAAYLELHIEQGPVLEDAASRSVSSKGSSASPGARSSPMGAPITPGHRRCRCGRTPSSPRRA